MFIYRMNKFINFHLRPTGVSQTCLGMNINSFDITRKETAYSIIFIIMDIIEGFGPDIFLNISLRQLLHLSFESKLNLLITLFFNNQLELFEKLLQSEESWPEMECHTQFEEQLHMFLANTNVTLMFNRDSTSQPTHCSHVGN